MKKKTRIPPNKKIDSLQSQIIQEKKKRERGTLL